MLFQYECRKSFINNRLIFIVLAVILVSLIIAISGSQNYPINIDIYRSYMTKWHGEFDNDKMDEILAEQARVYELLSSERAMEERYLGGEIPDEEYSLYTNQLWEAKNQQPVIDYIVDKTVCFEETGQYGQVLYYDIEAETFLKNIGVDWIQIIAILLVALTVLTEEYRTGAYQLLLTTPLGRSKTYRAKYAVTALYSGVVVIIIQCLCFAVALYKYDFGDMNAPIQSLVSFAGCVATLSVRSYMICFTLYRSAYDVCLGLLVFSLSTAVRNGVVLSFVSVCGLIAAYLFAPLLPAWLAAVLPSFGLNTTSAFCSLSPAAGISPLLYALIASTIITAAALLLGRRKYLAHAISA